eukprot:4924700-Heterocapsa_arctica.AAC.1
MMDLLAAQARSRAAPIYVPTGATSTLPTVPLMGGVRAGTLGPRFLHWSLVRPVLLGALARDRPLLFGLQKLRPVPLGSLVLHPLS